MSTWAAIVESKRGAAELLKRAAERLEECGAEEDDLLEAMAAASSAKLALQGCLNAAAVMRKAASGAVDAKMLRAGKEAA